MLYTQLCRWIPGRIAVPKFLLLHRKTQFSLIVTLDPSFPNIKKTVHQGQIPSKIIQSQNHVFKIMSSKTFLGRAMCFFWVSPTPARSSATVPPLVPVVVPSLGLSSLSFCKTWKKVTPMPCAWAAQQMHWSRVSRSHFLCCTFCCHSFGMFWRFWKGKQRV